jgi:hypothetical protein
VVGIEDRFGASAPLKVVMEKLGFTAGTSRRRPRRSSRESRRGSSPSACGGPEGVAPQGGVEQWYPFAVLGAGILVVLGGIVVLRVNASSPCSAPPSW